MPRLSRQIIMPDIDRVARYARAPDIGPRVLFFTGGTAMNEISRTLKTYTWNSSHVMTPFDSGGSSAVLRDAFDMPAVGDIRSRLMALADDGLTARREIVALLAMRLPKDAGRKKNLARLKALAKGEDALVAAIKNPARRAITGHLQYFLKVMPEDFDLRGACIGNLILTSGYVQNGRKMGRVIRMFANQIVLRGNVMPVVEDNLHLVARLDDDRLVSGQHHITGKETSPLTSPVKDIWLTGQKGGVEPVTAKLPQKQAKVIRQAELICYAPGSFYSSLAATLRPKGVSAAIAASPGAKVYVPGLGPDPEIPGLDIGDRVMRLLDMLMDGAGGKVAVSDVLDLVILDAATDQKISKAIRRQLGNHGVMIMETPLTMPDQPMRYDPRMFNTALLSLV